MRVSNTTSITFYIEFDVTNVEGMEFYDDQVHVQMTETWPLLLFRPEDEASPCTWKDKTTFMNVQA